MTQEQRDRLVALTQRLAAVEPGPTDEQVQQDSQALDALEEQVNRLDGGGQ